MSSTRYSQFAIGLVSAAAALAAVMGAGMAANTDTIATAKGAVEITAIRHASLMLSWNGKHVLVDPAPIDKSTDFAALPKPDVIVYTHSHFDHFNAETLQAVAGPNTEIVAPQEVADVVPQPLKNKLHILANGQTLNVGGIPVEAVAMYNITPDRLKFHPKGKGNGYVLTFGDKRVYVAGDTEETPELAHLSKIDAAFLPMNLPYTETVEAAAQWVKDFKPNAVYPYHFRNGDGSKADLEAFKEGVGSASQVRVLDWY
jgi:L-ascorbate metabolism protein UlaG (beta-lactamase superfamily)